MDVEVDAVVAEVWEQHPPEQRALLAYRRLPTAQNKAAVFVQVELSHL